MLIRRILVGDRNRVLVIRAGRFDRILEPGQYWFWTFGRNLEFETLDVKAIVFESPWSDYLAAERKPVAERYFTMVETSDSQVAVVYFDGKLARVVGPGKRVLFWKAPVTVTAEVIEVKENPDVPAKLATALARWGAVSGATFAQVEDGKTGLLYLEGRFIRALEPGFYGFWNAAGAPRVDVVELRWQTLEIPGQEILTQDKVSIRVNVWAEYRVTDPVKAKQSVKDYAEYLYRTFATGCPSDSGSPHAGRDSGGKGGHRRVRGRHRPEGSRSSRCVPWQHGVEGHHSAGRDARHPQPGSNGGEAGPGQPHPSPRGDRCNPLAPQHRQTDGEQPSPGAAQGNGDAGEDCRKGRQDHRRQLRHPALQPRNPAEIKRGREHRPRFS